MRKSSSAALCAALMGFVFLAGCASDSSAQKDELIALIGIDLLLNSGGSSGAHACGWARVEPGHVPSGALTAELSASDGTDLSRLSSATLAVVAPDGSERIVGRAEAGSAHIALDPSADLSSGPLVARVESDESEHGGSVRIMLRRR